MRQQLQPVTWGGCLFMGSSREGKAAGGAHNPSMKLPSACISPLRFVPRPPLLPLPCPSGPRAAAVRRQPWPR